MERSEIYRRSRRNEAPVQCVADHGMHKDAVREPRVIFRARPLRDEIKRLRRDVAYE